MKLIKAEEMPARGDMDGKAVWMRVIEAIEELWDTKPEGTVH